MAQFGHFILAADAPAPAPSGTTTSTQGTATTPPATGGGGGEGFGMLLTFLPFIMIFYFLFIRPEQKRAKEKQAVMAGLKPKDKVVTIGGLFGTIVEIEGEEVVLLVDAKKDVKLRFRRSAIDLVEAAK